MLISTRLTPTSVFQTARSTLILIALCFATPATSATPAATARQYSEVVRAFNQLVSGRALVSDEGSELIFGSGIEQSQGNYIVNYAHSFPSGRRADGRESVWTDGRSILVDQVVDGVIARRYIASVEGPYNVLRIRPEHPDDSEFISRDCIRKSAEEGTACYVKVRYMDDVIVSVYREKKSD